MPLTPQQLDLTSELCEIVRLHNIMLKRLEDYRREHPYLLPPNVARMMEDNLKENIQMLYKEMNNLHKPKSEQRRYTCRECHHVFASPLRGGLCDECRSRAYGTRPDYDAVNRTPVAGVVETPAAEAPPAPPPADPEAVKLQTELLAAIAEMEAHEPSEYPRLAEGADGTRPSADTQNDR
ncbi:MAG: hypothetical protein N2111_02120 [Candidatus Sumerlaeaceae bacterium]|nr:hypothetical protein [Candidatus Sumerlaeaceae bacterium]